MGYDTEEIIPNIELFNSLCTKLEKILEKICDPNLRSLENCKHCVKAMCSIKASDDIKP